MQLFKSLTSTFLLLALILASGCAPEIGSREWCDTLDKKDKGNWTANDLGNYTQHCIFKSHKDAP